MIPHFIFVEMPLCYKGNPRFSGEVPCWLVELLLLIEGSFITCSFLLREFLSHVSSYWRSFLCPFRRDFTTCFFLLKEFSLSVHWSSSDQFNPVLSHRHIPGILLQFLDLLPRHQLQNIVYFINFFMTEGMVPLGVADTVQDGYPLRKAVCLRCQGNGISYIWNWMDSSTS